MALTLDVKPSGFEGATGGSGGGRQWIRNWKLWVGSGAIDLPRDLRIKFKVAYQTAQHPTYMDVTIYNVSKQTAAKVKTPGIAIKLEVGYENRLQMIFKGEAVYKRYGKENATDSFLNLICRSGDVAYRNAHVSKTLSAGHTFDDQVKEALKSMKQFGLSEGHIAKMDPRKFPRAITMFGMARDYMRRIAIANDASWTIHNDKIQLMKNKEGVPGSAIVLNSTTGMIGRPVQTFTGIEARCLLNPSIFPGCKVHIDEASINTASISPNNRDIEIAGGGNLDTILAPFPTDGIYIVHSVEHTGDNRGQEWYTDIVCNNAGAAPSQGGYGDANLGFLSGNPVIELTEPNPNSNPAQDQATGGQGRDK